MEEPLKLVPAVAMLGGTALYLLAHIAFRLRNVHTLNRQRLLCAVAAAGAGAGGDGAAVARDARDPRRAC